MSPLDVLADLRETRPAAPAELRERVQAITAAEPAPRRRLHRPSWRLAVVAVAIVALAAAAAAVVLGRGGGSPATVQHGDVARSAVLQPRVFGAATQTAPLKGFPAPSGTRLQNYDATLSLRVRDAAALSDATKRALRIVGSLGGYATVVNLDVSGRDGDATLRVRVPVGNVQKAMLRLSALGTITGESVSIQDAQTGVDTLDRSIARLQRRLRDLRAQPQTDTVKAQIAALTTQVERLQRQRAAAVRTARLATIQLQLTTRTPVVRPAPAKPGPLHGALVALTWLGIGAFYALVVGGPVVALLLAA